MNPIQSQSQTAPVIHFSIRTKIFLMMLIPSLLLVFVILMDYRNLTLLGQSAELILSKNYKSIQAAQRIREHLEMIRNQILLRMFNPDESDAELKNPTQEIAHLLDTCRNNITEPGEQAIIDELVSHYRRYQALLANMMRKMPQPAAFHEHVLDFLSLTATMIGKIDALVSINEHAMEQAEEETKQFARKALRYAIGLMIAALLCTLILSYLLSTRISMPLILLAQTLSTIKEGSGSYPELPVRTKDEIGFLTSEFNRLVVRLKIYDRESADRLLAEREKVHQAEIAKAQFIADLSHQLKTPMTSLNMSVGLLHDKAGRLSPEKQRTLLETAKEDCIRLASLINELVDIARLEAMVKPRQKEVLDIDVVIQECLRPLIHQAEEKHITLRLDIAHDIPPVAVDSLRFPWVITNLTGNAIRYTNSGGSVTLKAYQQGSRLYVQCIDTGVGICAAYLSKIFDRYTQFSEREKSGTIGLGLAIVKEIIEQHGGAITVQSQLNQGTTFTFWIPLSDEEHTHEERADY
ncbi:HAMP domain-containing protein [candidate division KSB3 bacterium]|uniref:histidine kinase n=1 Tax=candidate division KSB3 bacterium TaxID=2044937 RepID=A0A9D5JWV9_9BACT|nr:HAMP domain-containing protein [candidate division KSB3 bacterium]MBD3325608.1 HAMP domain-containing protein [candidate division KSB3 bacterium]